MKLASNKGNGERKSAIRETDGSRVKHTATTVNGGGVQWADCPGCPKCRDNNGLVLRRGSWRPTSSWEPILMLAKSSNYFSDGEPVKTPAAAATLSRDQYTRVLDDPDEQFAVRHDHETTCDTGANARDVWRQKLAEMTKEELIALIEDSRDRGSEDLQRWSSEPLAEKHYASFPTALVRWCLSCGTSAKGYCPVEGCGKPWTRVVETKASNSMQTGNQWQNGRADAGHHGPSRPGNFLDGETSTIGWRPSCEHATAESRPALVLDPFSGSSRTGACATKMGLNFVGIELNPEYVTMSRRILNDQFPLFNVPDESPPGVPPDAETLS